MSKFFLLVYLSVLIYLSAIHEKQRTNCISSLMDSSIIWKITSRTFGMIALEWFKFSTFSPLKNLKSINFVNCSYPENLEVDFGKTLYKLVTKLHSKWCELKKCFAILTFKFVLQGIESFHLVWLEVNSLNPASYQATWTLK